MNLVWALIGLANVIVQTFQLREEQTILRVGYLSIWSIFFIYFAYFAVIDRIRQQRRDGRSD